MTARERVLHALQAAGQHGCTTAQLCQPDVGGVRFGARLAELRAEGHHITGRPVRAGSHRYVLLDARGVSGVPAWVAPHTGNSESTVGLGGTTPMAGAPDTLFDPRELHRPAGPYTDLDKPA